MGPICAAAFWLPPPSAEAPKSVWSAACESARGGDLAALRHPPTTLVHDLASRLRCSKCAKAGRQPSATLLQLAPRARQAAPET